VQRGLPPALGGGGGGEGGGGGGGGLCEGGGEEWAGGKRLPEWGPGAMMTTGRTESGVGPKETRRGW